MTWAGSWPRRRLQEARQDEQTAVRRQSGQQARCPPEHDDTGDEDTTGADQVGNSADQKQECREHDCVGLLDPLSLNGIDPEIFDDREL